MPKRRTRKIPGSTPENLVAVYFRNGIGNFIMLTPAIKALCEMHNAKVDIVLDPNWSDSRTDSVRELCNKWPLVNEIVEFDNTFNKDKYEQLFYSRHGETSDAYYYFERYAGYDAEPVNWRAEKLNEVDSYMNEVYRLGYVKDAPSLYCPKGQRSLNIYENPTNKDMLSLKVGLCNGLFEGSTWKWERKGWPYFGELIDLLNRFFGHSKFRIFLFGKGNREKKWGREMSERAYNVVDCVNNMNMMETIHMLRQCHLFITTDTGLMHVADAHDIPMIVLFGPTLVSKNGPYNKDHRIIRSPMPCAPCQASPRFHVCEEWKCMEALKPEMVFTEVREYLPELIKSDFSGSLSEQLAVKRMKFVHWRPWKKELMEETYGCTNNS